MVNNEERANLTYEPTKIEQHDLQNFHFYHNGTSHFAVFLL